MILEYPRLPEFVMLTSAEAESGVFDSTGETIYDHRITMVVDDVLDLTNHAS